MLVHGQFENVWTKVKGIAIINIKNILSAQTAVLNLKSL